MTLCLADRNFFGFELWNQAHSTGADLLWRVKKIDEIFGRDNFGEIIWRIGWISGYKSADKNWIRNHDTILFYSKDKNNLYFDKKYIAYPKDYKRRDGAKPEGEGYPYEDTWNCNELVPLNSIAIVSFSKEKVGDFKGQKNEALIRRIIEAHTKKGDLVIDFFSGTGTTASVAHKLQRQWISIEQIDKSVEKQLIRLKGTIDGDQYGISKVIGWEGGGAFVYMGTCTRSGMKNGQKKSMRQKLQMYY